MSASYHHGIRVVEVDSGTRPIRSLTTAVIGVVGTAPDADAAAFPLDTPVLIAGSRSQAAKLDTTGDGLGTLAHVMDAIFQQTAPLIIVVRIASSEDEAEQLSHVIGNVAADGHYSGLQALLGAQTQLGIKPRLLGAPGFSHQRDVADALGTLAENLRAFAYVDLSADKATDAITQRENFGQRRLMLLWPAVSFWSTRIAASVPMPASAFALGLRAKIDNHTGWYKVISNEVLAGINGLSHPVTWDLQNPTTDAGLLNQNAITTLIRQDGFRFWGSRTCSADPRFAFESAVRTSDILCDTIAQAHLWAMDKPLSQTLIQDIIDGINTKFRALKTTGHIVNAHCYLDPEYNLTDTLGDGQLHLHYDFTAVPPLEQMCLYTQITDQYLIELLPQSQA